jgi:exodeoxyribonuclease III
MRIISVNVNGIQTAVERGLLSWLQAQNADVICLQDTRASAFELDDPAYQLDGYFLYACDAEVPAQGGVALYSRLQPKAVITGLGFETADRYGRYLQADFDKVSIATLLLPSGQNGDEDLNQKFKLMDDFARYLDKQRRKRREYIYCGSLYVAQQKLDIKNWRDSQQSPGFLAPERAWMDEIVGNMGYVDALREVSREGDQYSWWPDNEQAEMLNLGWRFDYQLLTPGLRRFVRSARMPRQPRFSQHAPLIVGLRLDTDYLSVFSQLKKARIGRYGPFLYATHCGGGRYGSGLARSHKAGVLLERPPGEGVTISHPVIGLDPGNHHQHHRTDQHQAQQRKADQHEHQHIANGRGNRHGDLEVHRFLALIVDKGIALALYLPQDQRADQAAKRKPHPQERRKMTEHGPFASVAARSRF